METKRTLIAVVLSLIVLVGWGYFSEFMGWTQKPAPVVQTTEQTVAQPTPAVPPTDPAILAIPVFQASEGREVTVETPYYKAVFHTGGGVLQQFLLKNYTVGIEKDSPFVDMVDAATKRMAPLGLLVNGQPSWSTGSWSFDGGDVNLAAGQEGTLRFHGLVDGIKVVRELHFAADTYLISEKLLVASSDDAMRAARIGFTLGATTLSEDESQYNRTRIAWFSADGLEEEADVDDLATGVQYEGLVDWAGVMSNYFLAAIAPTSTNATVKGKLQDGVYRVAIEEPSKVINAGATELVECSYWLGPKEDNLLSTAPSNLATAMDLGWFGFIARPLLVALEFFYNYVGNYGIAIILLTICIKAVFWPLSQKSYKSMEQMKKLQPMMVAIREKYADDREKMNAEIMGLYKTYKVNPAGGCLPMLVQIPVFFGLYQALLNSIQLRHASFIEYVPFTDIIWLADLSAKDPFYITPIVMGATMFLQQRLAPPAGDPTQAKVMMFMPVIFTFMFLAFPSGLVVYWLCNNVLSIGQQWLMLRRVK